MKTLIALALAALLAACASTNRDYIERGLAPEELTLPSDMRTWIAGRAVAEDEAGLREAAVLFEARTDINDARKQSMRRELLHSLLDTSDRLCEDYLTRVNVSRTGVGVATEISASALLSAGTLATPVESANILSAVGNLFNTANGVLDRRVFASQDMAAILIAVRRLRDSERGKLAQAISAGDIDTLQIGTILAIARRYHTVCGVTGLQAIATAEPDRTTPAQALLGLQ